MRKTLLQTHPYLQERWQRVGRQLAFACKDLRAWKQWQRRTVRILKQLTGYATTLPVSPVPKITEEREFDDYLRQRIEIRTEPRVSMPCFALIPKQGTLLKHDIFEGGHRWHGAEAIP